MGQLKWTWFYAKPKKLIDIQTLDSASRGPLGSITTLFKETRRSLASLGAVTIIFLLAFDPFIQQIISYPIRLTTVDDKISPAITKRLGYFTPELDYGTVYSTGLWSEDTILSPDCPSGNCTWSKFQSSGMCSQCSDITQSVDLKCEIINDNSDITSDSRYREVDVKCDLAPPQGNANQFNLRFAFASGVSSVRNWSWSNYLTRKLSWHILSAYDFNSYNIRPQTKNQPFASPSDPLMVIGYAEIGYNKDYLDSDLVSGIRVDKATQCSLELCVLEYDVSVKNGTPNVTTSVLDYGELFWKNTSDPNISLGRTTCWKPRSSPQDITFENSKHGTFFQLSPVEFAFCGINFEIPLDESVFVGYTNQSSQGSSTKLDKLQGDPNTARIASVGLEKIMSNVAQHMNKEALHQNGSEVHGKAYITEVFVEVKWLWLILPIILVISGTLFIAMVIFENKKNGTSLWKSSVLAFLYHGLYNVDKDDSMAASVMEKKAEGLVVRLQASGDHGGLILKEEENSV